MPHNFEKIGIKAKKSMFLANLIPNQFNIAQTCRDVGINRKTFYRWCKSPKFKEKVGEIMEERGDLIEAAIFDNATLGKDTIAQIFLCKTILKKRGYYEGTPAPVEEKPSEKAIELLASLIDGQEDVKTVALEFTKAGIPLPEAIKILLSKEPPEEEEVDETEGMPTEEELEERGRKAMEDYNRQIGTFVPERRAEVEEIKEELKDQDSFAEEAIGNGEAS